MIHCRFANTLVYSKQCVIKVTVPQLIILNRLDYTDSSKHFIMKNLIINRETV